MAGQRMEVHSPKPRQITAPQITARIPSCAAQSTTAGTHALKHITTSPAPSPHKMHHTCAGRCSASASSAALLSSHHHHACCPALIRAPPRALVALATPRARPCSSITTQQQTGWHSPTASSSCFPRSRRQPQLQARVFDKFKDMFTSSSSGSDSDSAAAAGKQEEGSDMVRIDMDSSRSLDGSTEEAFGPLAVLLVGFMQPEVDAFRAMMNDMDADIVKVIPCAKAMLGQTLLQAFGTEFPQYEQPPLGQRRAMFFSGMYGSEVTEVISAYREAGFAPCVFAGLVPNNAGRTVGELLDAVWRDHSAMMAKLQEEQAAAAGDNSY